MAEEINYDELSDEEFLAALDNAGYEDNEGSEQSSGSEEAKFEDTDPEGDDYNEYGDDADTNDQDDGSDNGNTDGDDNDGLEKDPLEGNAQVEGDNNKDGENQKEDGDADGDDDGNTDGTKSEDAETGSEGDGQEDGKTEDIDYKKLYEENKDSYDKYKEFYDIATSEFTANGKKIKGFDDPRKIVQAQQMAAGFSDKMAGIKKYRPFMAPLEKRGMLEDSSKFDLAMSIIDGDKEAIKQHIKTLGINPIDDLDLEQIEYVSKPQTANEIELAFDDIIESATTIGKRDEVEEILLGGNWDKDSVVELLNDPNSSKDLISHMETGAYQAVQDRISEIARTDYDGTFGRMNSITKYRVAAKQLMEEYQAEQAQPGSEESERAEAERLEKVEAEKARIEKERSERAYQEKVAKKAAEDEAARKKASSASKRKHASEKKVEKFDPMKLSDDEFSDLLDGFMV